MVEAWPSNPPVDPLGPSRAAQPRNACRQLGVRRSRRLSPRPKCTCRYQLLWLPHSTTRQRGLTNGVELRRARFHSQIVRAWHVSTSQLTLAVRLGVRQDDLAEVRVRGCWPSRSTAGAPARANTGLRPARFPPPPASVSNPTHTTTWYDGHGGCADSVCGCHTP